MKDLINALRFADSSFPAGSFGFSSGMEALVGAGIVHDQESLERQVELILRARWATSDRVALVRAHRLRGSLPDIYALDAEYHVSMTSQNLRNGSAMNGQAFLTTHQRIGTPKASEYLRAVALKSAHGHLSVAQGFAYYQSGLSEEASAAVSAYTTTFGLCQSALRLGTATAHECQIVIANLSDLMEDLVAMPVGQSFSSFTPVIDGVDGQYQRQSNRLFAS